MEFRGGSCLRDTQGASFAYDRMGRGLLRH